jgi:hypothetical protein
VRNEAADAMERGALIPIRFDDARVPLPLRSIETIAMLDWPNHARNTELRALFHSIAEVLSREEPGSAQPEQSPSAFEPSLSVRVAQRVLDAISPQRKPDSLLRIERLIADVALSIARRQDPSARMAARLAAGLRDALGAIGTCFWHRDTLVHEDWSDDARAEHRTLSRETDTPIAVRRWICNGVRKAASVGSDDLGNGAHFGTGRVRQNRRLCAGT